MLKRTLPLAITFIVGILMVLDYFVKIPSLNTSAASIRGWMPLVTSFAVITGTLNLVAVHSDRIRHRRPGWYNSAALFLFLAVTVIIGRSKGTTAPLYRFLYDKILIPCGSTMAGMTAFFIASASYRAFRATNADSTLLLISAALVMLGRVPIGEFVSKEMPSVAQWIMDVPNMAGQRVFLVCSGIGFMSQCLRIIVGLNRAHLSGNE
ncbi:MAG TPA: hypothetical protein GXX30_02460 [Firmicutes bacterium]|nr:hypothetical protein [Candidatus Fermentithermobacillaceae bacterium]